MPDEPETTVDPSEDVPTVESLQGRIQQLEANHAAEIQSLRQEAARYRVSRNDALRRAHALSTVIKAHNVSFSIDDADLSSLDIKDGSVTGDFKYEPKKISDKPLPNVAKGETGLTMDRIREMSAKELSENWDEVKTVLESQRKRG